MTFKKIELHDLHPANPLAEVIGAINENFDTLHDSLENLEGGGIIGPAGPKGDAGQDGREGPKGEKGDQGEQGFRGEQGPAGQDGKDGKDGQPGRDGIPGAVGLQGPAGVQGPKGETGAQGPAGPAGKDGLPGATGPQGVAGPAGAQGVSITNVAIVSGRLIITKSDGTTVDAGAVAATSTTAPAVGSPPVVGSAPNPMAPIVVTAPPGYKAANLDDGVELTLDTLAVQLNTAANRSLLFRVTTGTMNVRISGEIYWCNGNWVGNYGANYWTGTSLTTTYQQPFGWNFPWEGDKATYHVIDQTNRRLYRVTLIIGAGYKKNNIIMERLV